MIRSAFQETVRRYRLLTRGDGVVVAFSGGPDSTALLLLLAEARVEMRLSLHAAHLNHGLRGRESEEDQRHAAVFCSSLGVPFVARRVDLTGEASGKGNWEERARQARYRFLEGERRRLGFQRIALGHTRDDLVETLLMRLLRGSGLSGLAGLYPAVEGVIVRPLIEASRRQIIEFLGEQRVPWRVDSTNQDLRFLRNRLRHHLLPLLEERYNPRIRERLADAAELLRDDEQLLEQEVSRQWAGLLRPLAAGSGSVRAVALDRAGLLALPAGLRRRIIRRAIRFSRGNLRRIGRQHVEQVLRLAERGSGGEGEAHLPGGIRARAAYGLLSLDLEGPGGDRWTAYHHPLPVPGRLPVEEIGCSIRTWLVGPEAMAEGEPSDPRRSVVLSPAVLAAGPLAVRSRRPGDRFRPAGSPGSRKVSRMLIDQKIPRHLRRLIPLIVCGKTVLWLPGEAPEERFRRRREEGGLWIELEPDRPAD